MVILGAVVEEADQSKQQL